MSSRPGAVFMAIVTVAAAVASVVIALTGTGAEATFTVTREQVADAFDRPVATVAVDPAGGAGTVAAFRFHSGERLQVRWQGAPEAPVADVDTASTVHDIDGGVLVTLPRGDGSVLTAEWYADADVTGDVVDRLTGLLYVVSAGRG